MRGWFGNRFWNQKSDDGARFLALNGMPMRYQKRNAVNKCSVCWDAYSKNFSTGCSSCSGTGFNYNLQPFIGLVQHAQPSGNDGAADISMRAGGRMRKTSVYLYVDKLTAQFMNTGDRVYYNLVGVRFENELIIMNEQPQVAMKGEVMLFLFECETPTDQVLMPQEVSLP